MFVLHQQKSVPLALDLLKRTQIAFARTERNGIKIDRPYLEQAIYTTEAEMNSLQEQIRETPVWQRWVEIFPNATLTNRTQLGTVLFVNGSNTHPRCMGFASLERTETGQPQVSENVLDKIPELGAFGKLYSRWMSLAKMKKTNLEGIRSVLDENDFIHPSFSIFSVISYRTSSSHPNFQNFPNHNAELSSIVRRCFIPRHPSRHIAEIDYSGAEVRVNAAINHDTTLLASIHEGHDFHKDIAAMAYMLPKEEITKQLRSSVKGPYTFAAFYGAHWTKIAKGLWDVIVYGGLTLADGTPLRTHIANQGIAALGNLETPEPNTYASHIKTTFDWFWQVQFKEYAQWKDDHWKKYIKNLYVDTPSGFRVGGAFTRNITFNIPAQGGASHCLLWSFCRVDELLRHYGFRACLVGQIHDSIVVDIPHKELDSVLSLMNDVMTRQLPHVYRWLDVPMEVEADVAPQGKSWYEKKPYPITETVVTEGDNNG